MSTFSLGIVGWSTKLISGCMLKYCVYVFLVFSICFLLDRCFSLCLSFSLSLPTLFLSTLPKIHWISWVSLEVIVLLPEPIEWGDYSRVHSDAVLSVNGGLQALLPCKHRVFLLPKLKFILLSWSYVLTFPHLSVFHCSGPFLASSPDQLFFVPIMRKMYY